MKCPYCNQEMKCGLLHGEGGRSLYWKPYGVKYQGGWFLTKKAIEKSQGFVLGETQNISFIPRTVPYSYYCPECKIVLTKLDEQAEQFLF